MKWVNLIGSGVGLILALGPQTARASQEFVQPLSIDDAVRITRREDGRFDILCKDGRTQLVEKAEILADRVCVPVAAVSGPVRVEQCEQKPTPEGSFHYRCPLETRSVPVEILWIVDDSGSMGVHQARVAEASTRIFEALEAKGLSWKMGLMTTDVERGPVLGFGPNAPEFSSMKGSTASDFRKAVLALGDFGSAIETPWDTFEKVSAGTQFFTPDRYHVVILVSDADDQSTIAVDQVVGGLQAASPMGLSVFGLVSADRSCSAEAWVYPGSRHEQIFARLRSRVYDLCGDASDHLRAIGENIVMDSARSIVAPIYDLVNSRSIVLFPNVDRDSIRVSSGGIELPRGIPGLGYWDFWVSDNRIRFYDFNFVRARPVTFDIEFRVH